MHSFMPHFTLPLPDGTLPLPLTLGLVDALEQTGGSLYTAAEALVARQLPLGDVLRLLDAAYKCSGCMMDDDRLQSFLMANQPATLLTRLFSAILSPLIAAETLLGEAPAGEAMPANAG